MNERIQQLREAVYWLEIDDGSDGENIRLDMRAQKEDGGEDNPRGGQEKETVRRRSRELDGIPETSFAFPLPTLHRLLSFG